METGERKPMRFLASCFGLWIAVLLASPFFAQAAGKSPDTFLKEGRLDLDAVVKHFEDLYRSDSSISIADFTVTRPRSTRTMTMKIWTRGRDKTLIVILRPVREEGTATLKADANLWNYLPRIKRTIRIPPSMMLASWMGSDFTNDDLVRSRLSSTI
jgi:Outer membrane lipoprotein-sorting protein